MHWSRTPQRSSGVEHLVGDLPLRHQRKIRRVSVSIDQRYGIVIAAESGTGFCDVVGNDQIEPFFFAWSAGEFIFR